MGDLLIYWCQVPNPDKKGYDILFYPEDTVEEIRVRNDIVDVIGSYISLKKKGANHMGLCPFHNERTPSFSVSQNKQLYHCFGCGVGGNVFTFIMEFENYSFVEALKHLAERSGVNLPEEEQTPQQKRNRSIKARILEIHKDAATYYYYILRAEQGKHGYKYLIDRGLSEESINKFGLGYSDRGGNGLYKYLKDKGYEDTILKEAGLFSFKETNVYDRFWNRVMFPIMDVNNKVIGFGGRLMGEGEPKYLNSPETKIFDKSRNLYGLNFARASRKSSIIICEGYMDVMALHQAGFNNAVASLGTAFTSQQASLLKRYTDEVLLCYDSDSAGVKAAVRAIEILRETGLTTKVIDLSPQNDPDDFIKEEGIEEFEKRIENAQNAFMFEIVTLEKDFDLNDPAEKTRFFNEVAKKLLIFSESIERNSYTETIARQYQITFDDLRKLVNAYGARMVEGVDTSRTARREERNNRKNEDDGLVKCQKVLITWLIDKPELFSSIEGIIEPEDFSKELYVNVTDLLFKQYKNEGTLNPAKIINNFETKEEQTEVASLFTSEVQGEMTLSETKKAFKDMVVRIKTNSLDKQINQAATNNDPVKLQGLIAEISGLQNLHISFYDG